MKSRDNLISFLIIIMAIVVTLFFAGRVHAIDVGPEGKIYGGFAVVFNAETGQGFIYANNQKTSVLVVLYPSSNRVYHYSANGQHLYFADDMVDLIRKYGINDSNILSIIKPVR